MFGAFDCGNGHCNRNFSSKADCRTASRENFLWRIKERLFLCGNESFRQRNSRSNQLYGWWAATNRIFMRSNVKITAGNREITWNNQIWRTKKRSVRHFWQRFAYAGNRAFFFQLDQNFISVDASVGIWRTIPNYAREKQKLTQNLSVIFESVQGNTFF